MQVWWNLLVLHFTLISREHTISQVCGTFSNSVPRAPTLCSLLAIACISKASSKSEPPTRPALLDFFEGRRWGGMIRGFELKASRLPTFLHYWYSKGISFSGGTGIWTQDFMLAKQAFYHFSHSASPICVGYFWGRVLNYLLGAGFKPWSSWSLPPE
jgi:hypothetical protein